MRDFDAERKARLEEAAADPDRSTEFKIAGEVFKLKPTVRPEVMAIWEDLPITATSAETYAALDQLIKEFMEPEGHERWDRIRIQDEDPVTARDLWEVWYFVLANNTAFPTKQLEDSSGGPGKSEDTSKESASKPVIGTVR